MPTKSQLCQICGNCCSFFILQTPKPFVEGVARELREYFQARGIEITREKEKWFNVKIPMPCPHLKVSFDKSIEEDVTRQATTKFSCDIYPFRPELCKNFDGRLVDRHDNLNCLWKTEKIEEGE